MQANVIFKSMYCILNKQMNEMKRVQGNTVRKDVMKT